MVFSILFDHIVEICSNVWWNDVRLFSIMFGSLDWLPKFCLAGNYVGRFLDLWFLLLLFISNFVRLYGIMFSKWAGASREETYGQSWDEYIFRRFSWFILIISSVQSIFSIYTGNWWDPYGGSKPWSCLNSDIYNTQHSQQTCALRVKFKSSGSRNIKGERTLYIELQN